MRRTASLFRAEPRLQSAVNPLKAKPIKNFSSVSTNNASL
jgi:hypothetical protein